MLKVTNIDFFYTEEFLAGLPYHMSCQLFLAAFCWKESQCPHYSPGLGAMVTNDWCLTDRPDMTQAFTTDDVKQQIKNAFTLARKLMTS